MALYNHLFAKKHNGKWILRVEDTDAVRFSEFVHWLLLIACSHASFLARSKAYAVRLLGQGLTMTMVGRLALFGAIN